MHRVDLTKDSKFSELFVDFMFLGEAAVVDSVVLSFFGVVKGEFGLLEDSLSPWSVTIDGNRVLGTSIYLVELKGYYDSILLHMNDQSEE